MEGGREDRYSFLPSFSSILLVACLIFGRMLNALFVRTYFNPDEYWQGPEVAHRLVYGYGHLTWEWWPVAQIRGFAHPLVFAALYRGLQLAGLDSRWAVAYGPRLLQGALAGIGDFCLYCLARRLLGAQTARAVLCCQLASWFYAYCAVRTYSSSLETVLLLAALCWWPLRRLPRAATHDGGASSSWQRDRCVALSLAAIGVLVRPPLALTWAFLGLHHIAVLVFPARDSPSSNGKTHERRRGSTCAAGTRVGVLGAQVVVVAAATLGLSLLLDRACYRRVAAQAQHLNVRPSAQLGVPAESAWDKVAGSEIEAALGWPFPPANFVAFNLLRDVASFYGTHPWHWYLTEGFPAILGLHLPLYLLGIWLTHQARERKGQEQERKGAAGTLQVLLGAQLWTMAALSATPHKEIRFLLPLLPLAMLHCGVALQSFGRRRAMIAALVLVLVNGSALAYLGRWHQAGPVAALDHLAAALQRDIDEHGVGLAEASAACDAMDGKDRVSAVSMTAPETELRRRRSRRKRNSRTETVLEVHFLTGCHATPYYAALHLTRPIALRDLDCSPPGIQSGLVTNATGHDAGLAQESQPIEASLSEQARFAADPVAFVAALYGLDLDMDVDDDDESAVDVDNVAVTDAAPAVQLPRYLVLFDSSVSRRLAEFLWAYGYRKEKSFFHSHVQGDADVAERHQSMIIYVRPHFDDGDLLDAERRSGRHADTYMSVTPEQSRYVRPPEEE